MLKSLRTWAFIAAMLAPCAAVAQSSGPSTVYPLLVNATASGNLFANVYGGNYQINLAGTVGGSTVTVTVADASGVQQTVATFTAIGTQCIAIPANATMQGVVTGGTPSGLYLKASGVQFCPTTSVTVVPSGPQTIQPLGVISTDASGTVTTGGAYQTIQAATATRHGCTVQNPLTATETLNVRVGTTTAFFLAPGSAFNCEVGGIVVTDAIAVTAATTAHAFAANFQ